MTAPPTDQRGRVRVERSQKRVRVVLNGRTIADSTDAKLVWEKPYYPTYYFPATDVDTGLLVDTGETDRSPSRGTYRLMDVKAGDRTAEQAAAWLDVSELDGLDDTVRFDWGAMDHWFEEDEEVFVHPRDPYTRVDILQSSRSLRIEIDGVTVAETTQPRLLFETGLPVRYYLPKTDVRLDLLRPTNHHTECPYKGTASYYSVEVNGTVHENLAWWYPTPTLESAGIAGYVCFYDERVDVYVDGALQERPKTPFS